MAGNPKQGFHLIEGAGQPPLVAVNQPDATVAQLLLLANGLGPRAYTDVRRIVSGIVDADGRDDADAGEVCAWLLQRDRGGLIIVMPASCSMESIGTVTASMIQGGFMLLRFGFGTVRTAPGIAASGTKVVVAPVLDAAVRRG